MKKIILILAVLMLATPVMAEPNSITITATQVSSAPPAEVEITYLKTSGKIPRAFALDITVTAGTIVDVGNFFVGECNDSNGYGIFPASFNRYINPADPNWADVNVNYTPVAEPCDLPGGTQPGIGFGGVTIEMGSLYDASKGKGPPEVSGTLCSIFVDSDCHVDLALNVGRAGIVMEDGNQPDNITLTECDVVLVCTVPLVVGDANLVAQAAIIAANFTIGDITTECSVTVADGNVINQDPGAGGATCGTAVDLVVSTGPLASVPDVLDMNGAAAIAAINAVSGLTAGTPTYECNDTIADGNVISQDPGAGATCDATVDLVISTGSCCSYPASWDYLAQCHGDATGEGECGVLDFYELRDGWDKTHPHADYLAHSGADFDRDGYVGILDFYILRDNWDTFPAADCPTGDPCGVYCP